TRRRFLLLFCWSKSVSPRWLYPQHDSTLTLPEAYPLLASTIVLSTGNPVHAEPTHGVSDVYQRLKYSRPCSINHPPLKPPKGCRVMTVTYRHIHPAAACNWDV
ncbi:MAG: hypothetical protein QW279_05045, partial [Candidatus Jordarchaeaceae archaeon]